MMLAAAIAAGPARVLIILCCCERPQTASLGTKAYQHVLSLLQKIFTSFSFSASVFTLLGKTAAPESNASSLHESNYDKAACTSSFSIAFMLSPNCSACEQL